MLAGWQLKCMWSHDHSANFSFLLVILVPVMVVYLILFRSSQ